MTALPKIVRKDAPDETTDDIVAKALKDFTETVDERLTALEKKTAANDAPEADTKTFDDIKARLDKMEAKAQRPGGVHVVNKDEPSHERKSFGSYLRRGVERMEADEIKALTVSTDAEGGFLAPEEVGSELIKLLNEFSPLRRYARVTNISASEIKYPRRVSGTAATWTDEIADRTESSMSFEQIKVAAHELATYVDVSYALLEDNTYGLESELLADFAESFAKTEGLAFVKGDGAGQPRGIMYPTNGIAELEIGSVSGGGWVPNIEALIAAYHAIPTTHAQSAAWMMNRSTLAALRQQKYDDGRFIVIEPITASAPSTILGRPIIEMPDMDDLDENNFPILFGDMSGYRIFDRIGLNTLRDNYTIATKGQVRFHARKRVGADLTHPDRFIKLKCVA